MATRLHVQKKHIVEYAQGERFHNNAEAINTILSEYCGYIGSDDYEFSADRRVSVVKDDLKKLVKDLKEGNLTKSMIEESLGIDFEYEHLTIDELAEGFSFLLENADKKCEYVHLEWW